MDDDRRDEADEIKVERDNEDRLTYEVTVSRNKDGVPRRVVMRELNAAEFMNVLDAGGGDFEISVRGIRRALVSDRGETLEPKDTAGALLSKRFRTPELLALQQLWLKIHSADEATLRSIQDLRVG